MVYGYARNVRKPIDRLDAALQAAPQVDALTGNKILHYPSTYTPTGILLLVIGGVLTLITVVQTIQGNYGLDSLLIVLGVAASNIFLGMFFLRLQHRKVILTAQGLESIGFFGRCIQFDWSQVTKVGYRVWDQALIFHFSELNKKRNIDYRIAVSAYENGIGELAKAIRDNLKIGVYQPVTFLVDYAISRNIGDSPKVFLFWDRDVVNNQLLGGGTLGQRFIKVYWIGLVIAGVILCPVGYYDLYVNRSDDASYLAAGFFLIGVGLLIRSLMMKSSTKKMFLAIAIIVMTVLSIYILSIMHY